MTNRKTRLLQTILEDAVIVPPPPRQLVNEQVGKWIADHEIASPSFWTAAGELKGFKSAGANALKELSGTLLKENMKYAWGTTSDSLADAAANVILSDIDAFRNAGPISAQVELLEARIDEWFSSVTESKTYFVPCSIIPYEAPSFSVGPVEFLNLPDFIEQEKIASAHELDSLGYDAFFRFMETWAAWWIGRVTIEGCEPSVASELANRAVDVALTAIQLVMPIQSANPFARIGGRTTPPSASTVYKTKYHTNFGSLNQHPGLEFSAGYFEQCVSRTRNVLDSAGKRLNVFVKGAGELTRLTQAWNDAAYWLHEGLSDGLDSIAVAKLETAIEILLSAESTKGSQRRLWDAFKAFYGLEKSDPIQNGSNVTVNAFVKDVVEARSRVLHGTWSTLSRTASVKRTHLSRRVVEMLATDLVRRFTLMLDEYAMQQDPVDQVEAFLQWVTARTPQQSTEDTGKGV